MPIDPSSGVPARGRLQRRVCLDGDNIVTGDPDVGCQIILKADVSAGPLSKMHPVDPHVTDTHDTIKLNGDLFTFCRGGHTEMFSIPHHSRRQEPSSSG